MGKNKKFTTLIALFLSVFAIGSLTNSLSVSKADADSALLSTPKVEWNNINYMGQGWAGELDAIGVPQNGYCLLALYSSNVASTTYTAQNVLDMSIAGCNVGEYIKINGVEAKDVDGCNIRVYPTNGIFVYFPISSIEIKKPYKYPTIEFLEGLTIEGTVKTVATRFEYRGAFKTFGNWVVDPVQPKSLPFTGIAGGWNNVYYPSTPDVYNLILSFGTHNKDWLANDKTPNATNRATKDYDIGTGLTVNGVTIAKLHDKCASTCVSYAHGFCFLYITYPKEIVELTKDYSVPTLHIDAGTEFMDTILPEVTLKMVAGEWLVTDSDEFRVENPIDLINHSFDETPIPYKLPSNDSKKVIGNLSEEGNEIAFNINTGDVDTTITNSTVHIALYTLTVVVNQSAKTVSLMQGGQILLTFAGINIVKNADYTFEFDIACGAQSTLKLAINHLLVIDYSVNRNISVGSDLCIWFLDEEGTWTIKEYEELKHYAPTLVYGGSSSYDFIEGDPVYNFASLVNAYSLYDDDITVTDVAYEYEEGAVTEGRYNAGTWDLTIILDVKDYEPVTKDVVVNVHGKLSIAKIRYDDGEIIEVPIGSKLVAPPNPPTYREGEYDYVFDGWYFNGARWDFDHDTVEGDMHLIAHYKAVAPHLKVTVNFTGITKISESYSLTKGSTLPFDVFELEGATFVVYLDGQVITSLVVNDDVTITVDYTVTYTYVEPKEATCTEEGSSGYWYSSLYADYTFADPNGKEVKPDGIIPKTGHKVVHLDYKDSTCSEVGNVDCYYCQNCKNHFSDEEAQTELKNWSIEKKAHIMTHHNHIDASCETDGQEEHWTCENEPGVYYADQAGTTTITNIIISAFGHDYRAPTYEWEETNNGYKCIAKITCTHCHDIISETKDATKVLVREATCTREGEISYSVRFVDTRFNAQTKIVHIEKTPHKYVFVEHIVATPSSSGVREHYECSECHQCFVKNGEQYVEVNYTDLVYYYVAPSSGCAGNITSTSLIIFMSAGAIALLMILRRKEAK